MTLPCHYLSSLAQKQHFVTISFTPIKACPRPSQSANTTKTDIQQLSCDVLSLRLQQLNLPIIGSRARPIERLCPATAPQPAFQGRPHGCRSARRVAKPTSTK